MKYSIVAPVYNEGENLRKLVGEIHQVMQQTNEEFEILIVNDNSTDNTLEILEEMSGEFSSLKPIHRTKGKGVGNTIRRGLKETLGDVIITLDGDLSHDPKEIPGFISAIEGHDMVCGSRYIENGMAEMNFSRTIISRTFNTLFGFLLRLPIMDFTSGFRAYRKEVIESIQLTSQNFGIYIEIPINVHRNGFDLTEIPIHYYPREMGKSKLSYIEQGPEYLKVIVRSILR